MPGEVSSEAVTASSQGRSGLWLSRLRQYAGLVCCLLGIILSGLQPGFLTYHNVTSLLSEVSIAAIGGFGITYVLLVGDIDLSVGSMMVVAGTLSALGINLGLSVGLVLSLTMLAAIALGAANGVMSARLGMPSVVVTLATSVIFQALSYMLLSGTSSIWVSEPSFLAIGNGDFFSISSPIWILFVLLWVNHFILSKTTFGRRIYFIGGSREAALYSGINISRVKIGAFIMTGVMAGISGVIIVARYRVVHPDAAFGYELRAITSALLGGTSLSGGKGTVPGTLIGALVIGVIDNGMSRSGIPFFMHDILIGALILIAVYIDVLNEKALV
jgi:ribose transport system permease protein